MVPGVTGRGGRVRLLLVALAAGLLSGPVAAAPARAATPVCVRYALATAYGAVKACTERRNTEARVGLRNMHTGEYGWRTGFLPVVPWDGGRIPTAPDRLFYGGVAVTTAYGPASWGTEIQLRDGRAVEGRFGWYNFPAEEFLADSGWLPVV